MSDQPALGGRSTPLFRFSPGAAAYLITAILALGFSYDLMRKPIQIPDSLIDILHMQESPSVSATFQAAVEQRAYLRPLRIAQVKALFDLADGHHYWLVFRGFHALLLVGVLWLFTRALRVQSWTDFAAAVFAITVLTGMHTFRGTVREAFPINHFTEVLLFCLLTLNLAQSRGGWWVDVAAGASFVAASLTLESGLLVWVVAVGAFACGMRGISRRGVVAMTLLLGAYLLVRFAYLSTGAPGLDERTAGVWVTMMTPDELARRFGADPTWFYVYNVVTSMLSVLFADPDRGVFLTARTWLDGEMPARLYLATVPTAVTTGFIAWVAVARLRGRTRSLPAASDQFLILFAVVLVANSVMSYAYTKHEIVSVAGAFYAFAAFAVARCAIEQMRQPGGWVSQGAMCVALAALASVWAFRSVGVHHVIQVQAFKEQLQWARLDTNKLAERDYPSDARARALAAQLRRDALDLRIPNPHLLPGWPDTWWGE